MMKSLIKSAGGCFLIVGAAMAGGSGLEALGLALFGVHYRLADYAFALLSALGWSLLLMIVITAALAIFRRADDERTARVAALAGPLALLCLLLIFGLKPFLFARDSLGSSLAGLVTFLVFILILGRGLWTFFDSRGDDSGVALGAFVTVATSVMAGISVSTSAFADRNQLSLAVIVCLLLMVLGYYGAYQALRMSGRERLQKWTLRAPALIIALVSIPVPVIWGHGVMQNRSVADAPGSSPSVVLITVDTLRADYKFSRVGGTSTYPPSNPGGGGPFHFGGGQNAVAPIDALAHDGVRFLHAVAPSTWTPPSVASIITGLYPTGCGSGILIPGDPYDYTGPLPGAETLAERFRDAGYVTAGFVDSAWVYPSRGYAQGFERYQLLEDFTERPKFILSRFYEFASYLVNPPPTMPAVRLADRIVDWIRRAPRRPFFLWAHFYDPHLPYYFQPRYPPRITPGVMTERLVLRPNPHYIRSEFFGLGDNDKEYVRQRYAGEVRFTEDQIGRVFSELKAAGLYDSSVIALTSDHGEEFWEHGGYEHGHSFHGEVIDVPLILKLPGNVHAGAEPSGWVSVSRVGATILGAAKIDSEFPGESLLPCVSDPSCGARSDAERLWYSEGTLYGREQGAVGDVLGAKAILHGDGSITCYNLAADPMERTPITEDQCPWPANATPPRDAFKAFAASNVKTFLGLGGADAQRSASSKGELDHLRALGYLE